MMFVDNDDEDDDGNDDAYDDDDDDFVDNDDDNDSDYDDNDDNDDDDDDDDEDIMVRYVVCVLPLFYLDLLLLSNICRISTSRFFHLLQSQYHTH